MALSIISPKEKALLKHIEDSNPSEVNIWRITNIIIPFFTIAVSLICVILFKSQNDDFTELTFLNLLVNGSIPMIALNRIGGMGIYVFKYDRSQEKKYGIEDTFWLRTKLLFMFMIVLIGTIFLYVYQVINHPFKLQFGFFAGFIVSGLAVYFAMNVSKKVYLLQDKFIDKTYDETMRDGITTNGHGNNW